MVYWALSLQDYVNVVSATGDHDILGRIPVEVLRSVADFNIIESLSQCKEYLLASGGHKMAAGLSINQENIELFRQKINQLAVSQGKLNA